MKFHWSSLLLFACFLSAVFLEAVGTNEADRLLSLIKSRSSMSLRNESSIESAVKYTYDSVYVGQQEGLMEADKIDAFPGQPKEVNFDQYAGYVTVDPKSERALFYYFAEAPEEPSKKPLVLWLNGGPGCSSLGGGAMMELGPFFVNKDGKTLHRNNNSWNSVANMLFLESPAGVGFSYSNTTSDYSKSGDIMTAKDSYTFLINWLNRFPQYKGRDFFITGESYAGHYIPQLAIAIIANNNTKNGAIINLKGIAIGNAYLDEVTNAKGNFEYYMTHVLMSKTTHNTILANCNNFSGEGFYTEKCFTTLALAKKGLGKIDLYNIYAPTCQHSSNSSRSDDLPTPADPCTGEYVESYLNQPEVQRALHANTTGLRYPWTECSGFIGWNNWTNRPATMLPELKQVIASGISVWLYSGDVDGVVSVTATQYSLDDLNLPVETAWYDWDNIYDYQVAGYVTGYKGLIFATVRGAGHMVPRDEPVRALILFSSFLQGELPPHGTYA